MILALPIIIQTAQPIAPKPKLLPSSLNSIPAIARTLMLCLVMHLTFAAHAFNILSKINKAGVSPVSLENQRFEEGLRDWIIAPASAPYVSSRVVSTDYGKSAIITPGPTPVTISQRVDCLEFNLYSTSCRFSILNKTPAGITLTMDFYDENNRKLSSVENHFKSNTSGWQHADIRTTSPASASYFLINFTVRPGDSVALDDYSILEGPEFAGYIDTPIEVELSVATPQEITFNVTLSRKQASNFPGNLYAGLHKDRIANPQAQPVQIKSATRTNEHIGNVTLLIPPLSKGKYELFIAYKDPETSESSIFEPRIIVTVGPLQQ